MGILVQDDPRALLNKGQDNEMVILLKLLEHLIGSYCIIESILSSVFYTCIMTLHFYIFSSMKPVCKNNGALVYVTLDLETNA